MKHFCMAPFVHVQKNSFNEFNPCCMFNKRIYHKHDSISSAFNSPENLELRKKMLNDEYIDGCEKCYRDESLDKISYRQRFNDRYLDKGYVENPKIKELEIALSNKCNFKCVDCNTKFSSSWYNDDILLGRTFYTSKGRDVTFSIKDEDYEYLELDEIKILGGEPFLEKRYLDIFKKIDVENISLFFVTNNSIFPSIEWIEQLRKFKNVIFNISIDGVYDVAEFVRYGKKFSKFENNYDKWISLNIKNMKIVPHYVFHSLNILNFDDTINWLKIRHPNENIKNVLSYDFLMQPDMLNLSFLPEECKSLIIDNIENFKDEIKSFLNTNQYQKEKCMELLKYYNFLNLRIDGPKQTERFMKCLRSILSK